MAKIRLNVFIRTTEAARDEVVRLARELTDASLRDAGCEGYDIYESTTRREVLMICETWRSEEDLAAHQRTEHFMKLVPALREAAELSLEKFLF